MASRKQAFAFVDCISNMIAHAQKPDFVFRRNGRVHLNRQGRQFSRLPAAEVCASAVVMLDTPCSEVVWRVLATHSIQQFPLHFPYPASPCAITFQLDSTGSRRSAIQSRLLPAGWRIFRNLGCWLEMTVLPAFPLNVFINSLSECLFTVRK